MTAAPVPQMRIELVRLPDLRRAERNPKDHDPQAIGESLDEHGYVAPMILDETTGRLVAGHGRLDRLIAMRAAGEPPPRRIELDADGEWLVPVVRGISFADDSAAEAYLLADNRIGEKAGNNPAVLAEVLTRIRSGSRGLRGTGYSEQDHAALLRRIGATRGERGGTHEIHKPENPKTQEGDTWRLGPHRLICGDSTRTETIAELLGDNLGRAAVVLTDAPYGIYGSSTGLAEDITDDSMVRPFYESIARAAKACLRDFGHAYVFCDWRSWAALWDGGKRAGLAARNLIVWDKGGGLGSSYAMTYELIGFFNKLPPSGTMRHGRKGGQRMVLRPNLMRYSRPTGENRRHNAAKPIGLLEELVANSSDKGELVVDLCTGSGTTLLAAENTGRIFAGAELDRGWCDVAVTWWEQTTGQEARRVPRGETVPAPSEPPPARGKIGARSPKS